MRRGDGGDFDLQMKDLDYMPEPGMSDEEILLYGLVTEAAQ